MIAISQTILLVCAILVVADGLITWYGTRKGFRELNPFLSHILRKSGLLGLVITRAAALGLLLFLFDIMSAGVWAFFGSTFALILGLIVSNDLRKLRPQKNLVL